MSDGCCEPAELVHKAAAGGLQLISLTDHDTVRGVPEARKVASKADCRFISGVELEAFIDLDGNSYSVHILGYGIDENDTTLLAALKKVHHARKTRARKMVSKLNNLGIEITGEEVSAFSHGDAVGRVHIAQALKENGAVAHIDEAFQKFIGDNKPAYAAKTVHGPDKIIDLIHSCGGVAVWAHPYYCQNDALLEPLMEAGIDGLECYHREFDPQTSQHYFKLARKNNLIVTGGSDYHGTLEENFELGDWWFEPEWKTLPRPKNSSTA
jgi:hypothetical protein